MNKAEEGAMPSSSAKKKDLTNAAFTRIPHTFFFASAFKFPEGR